jgi:hypothetical protein
MAFAKPQLLEKRLGVEDCSWTRWRGTVTDAKIREPLSSTALVAYPISVDVRAYNRVVPMRNEQAQCEASEYHFDR